MWLCKINAIGLTLVCSFFLLNFRYFIIKFPNIAHHRYFYYTTCASSTTATTVTFDVNCPPLYDRGLKRSLTVITWASFIALYGIDKTPDKYDMVRLPNFETISRMRIPL